MNKNLIFIVAYNHEKFLDKVLSRLPKNVVDKFKILIIDDASNDNTSLVASKWKKNNLNYSIEILKNKKNLGYGGNQKVGFKYAINNKFDTVTLLHGDGQYAPELINDLNQELINKNSDLLLGSRMINKRNALKGRMPLYKFIGNIILTRLQNYILNVNLSEFHTGYRVYNVHKLAKIPFELNSNDFHFDTEIIIQFILCKFKINEFPIPTYYGEEISYVNGFKYAFNVIKESLFSQICKLGIFHIKKYDFENIKYMSKVEFISTHSIAIEKIGYKEKIMDIGCSDGYLLKELHKKESFIKGVDINIPKNNIFNDFEIIDLDNKLPSDINKYDTFLLLDIIEHLKFPEKFLINLNNKIKLNEKTKIIASTGNIAFLVIRFMLLLGYFNYGRRGILDKTHTRLFTFKSFKKLFIDNGYDVEEIIGIPAPFSLAIGNNFLSKFLAKLNLFLIKISKGLFSYQIMIIAKPKVSLDFLLKDSIKIN